ncbi:hypothetical protein Bhyg_12609 [Pseudolycoriella hygida]|uniref:Uncharacterized protein n=1 Tax=Pseudolycoriella hygida TaxID=35572 RepID=A0A9Q0MXJ5_9DIPT|nr:hypothetical protein Bhyg_12609 [Pseudolycoriella hygida]
MLKASDSFLFIKMHFVCKSNTQETDCFVCLQCSNVNVVIYNQYVFQQQICNAEYLFGVSASSKIRKHKNINIRRQKF